MLGDKISRIVFYLFVFILVLACSFLILICYGKKDIEFGRYISSYEKGRPTQKLAWEIRKADEEKKEELLNIEFDTIFLSSKRCDTLEYERLEGHFSYPVQHFGWYDGDIESQKEIFSILLNKKDEIKYVYYEVSLGEVQKSLILGAIEEMEGTGFYLYFPPYSVEELLYLETYGGLEDFLEEEKQFLEQLIVYSNVHFVPFHLEDWVIKNPYYFQEENSVAGEMMYQLYRLFEIPTMRVELEMIEEYFKSYDLAIKEYANLQGKTIFYLGDSMYAQHKNQSGITEIASAFLNAKGYNLAIMGTNVSGTGVVNLSYLVEILTKNYSANSEDITIPESIEHLISEIYNMIPHYIVLQYGFNDYAGERELDEFTTKLRDSMIKLQESFPTTTIILSTPTMAAYDLGYDLTLDMYVEVMISVAKELGIHYLNNYDIDVFTKETVADYLTDGVHYNVQGRFRQAERLAEFISELEK